MEIRRLSLVGLLMLLTSNIANAENLSSLRSSGWAVVYSGTVSDTFKGCNYNLPVPLDGGYIFICREYNYRYAYRPEFLVMRRGSAIKYVIDGEVFDGELYRGTPIVTYVSGDFEGCDYDKLIPLENGLIFKCRSYRYKYAYRPKVIIVGDYVTIDGEKYEGTLYRR